MRIINVVTIKNGVVDNIDSFGVFEEQLSQDVVNAAEKLFVEKVRELEFQGDEEELDAIIGDGYYEHDSLHQSVCLSWSDI
jgi:hypothetical protein